MWKNDDRVLAKREPEEDYWYPGTIRHSEGSRHFVIFDGGRDARVGPSELRPLRLEVGDRVFVRRGGQEHEPGRIVDKEGDKLLITFKNDGQQAWTPLARVHVGAEAPQDASAAEAAQWDLGE